MSNSREHIAEVISIGDEMTSGARLDTNSQWLSVALERLGVRVLFHSTVGDSLNACQQVFATAANRASIVVVTGGLGPTQDDLTREALAAAAGVPLEFRPEAMAHIERLFARRGTPIPERNRIQAMFPASSRIIPNPQGTAPGIDMMIPTSDGRSGRVFALPGVPAEMQQMWDQSVAPTLSQHVGQTQAIRHAIIKCFGLGESDMEAMLGDMIARDRTPRVGITVSRATISLRIDAAAESIEVADGMIDTTRQDILCKVGAYIFGEGEATELHHAVVDRLARRGETLGVVECGWSASIATWLAETERPDVFRGGFQFPDMRQAAELARRLKPGDERAVAATYRECLGTDWCLFVDAYPSTVPPPGQVLPGTEVRFLIDGPLNAGPRELMAHIGGHPEILHARIGKAGLFELFRMLRDAES